MANTLAKDHFGAAYPGVRDAAGAQFVAPAAAAAVTDADGVLSAAQLVANGSATTSITAATTVVKVGVSRLVKIIVTAGTGAITAYDNIAAGGTTIWSKAAVAAGDIYALDIPCSTGITVTVAAATTALVVYS